MESEKYAKDKLRQLLLEYERNQIRIGDINQSNYMELERAENFNRVIQEEIKALTLDTHYKTNVLDNSYMINPKKHPGTQKQNQIAKIPNELLTEPKGFTEGKLYYNNINVSQKDMFDNKRYDLVKPGINSLTALSENELKKTINKIQNYNNSKVVRRNLNGEVKYPMNATPPQKERNALQLEEFTGGIYQNRKILDNYNANPKMLSPNPFAVGLNVPMEEYGPFIGQSFLTEDYKLRNISHLHPDPFIRNKAKTAIGKLPIRKWNLS